MQHLKPYKFGLSFKVTIYLLSVASPAPSDRKHVLTFQDVRCQMGRRAASSVGLR